MIRNLTGVVAVAMVLGVATITQAQTGPEDTGRLEGSLPGGFFGGNLPYGGFGVEYSQPLASGSVVMDQYGMLHAVPYVADVPAPPSAPVAAAPAPAPVRTSRSMSRSVPERGRAQPRYYLPTGNLGLFGGNSATLYSPVVRGQAYGDGYGYGPYGVSDYSMMWHGFPTR